MGDKISSNCGQELIDPTSVRRCHSCIMDGMPEVWDVVDEHGVPTGDVFRRGAGDLPVGRFHLAVAVCAVRSDGRLLMTQRSVTRKSPLLWEFAGGNARAGEGSEEAAVRELYEETGLAVEREALIHVGRYTEESALVDVFATEAPHTAVRLDPVEVHAAEWVHPEDMVLRLESKQMAVPWAGGLLALCPELLRIAGTIARTTDRS